MRQPYVTRSWMARTSGQLSPRDMAILRTLGRLRLASGEQLHRIHFAQDSNRNRRRVLRSLWERHLIARLDRRVGGYQAGSSSHLLTLDVAGQRLIDQEQGRTRWRRPSTPGAPFVAHVLAVTELYTQLVEIDRQGKAELLDFDAEPLCWRRFASRSGGTATLKPDAFVRVGIGEYADSFFVEVDRGSESPSTLLAKMTGYRAYWQSGVEEAKHGVFPRVLFTVLDERRYQVVVDLCSRMPAESWMLYRTTLFTDAAALMAGVAP